jgi:hypothetical protein
MLMHGREPDGSGGPQICRPPKFGEIELCWIHGPEILKQSSSRKCHRSLRYCRATIRSEMNQLPLPAGIDICKRDRLL